jgi:hypothetical protein
MYSSWLGLTASIAQFASHGGFTEAINLRLPWQVAILRGVRGSTNVDYPSRFPRSQWLSLSQYTAHVNLNTILCCLKQGLAARSLTTFLVFGGVHVQLTIMCITQLILLTATSFPAVFSCVEHEYSETLPPKERQVETLNQDAKSSCIYVSMKHTSVIHMSDSSPLACYEWI